MALMINTNTMSLNAQRNLTTSSSDLSMALQRLSSGLRVNSSKDDAAGLAIASRMTTQINGLEVAQRNANDGISLSQTTEGALQEVTNNLQRIRELAVQSANATNSAADRQALDQEVQQRLAEIQRISVQTSFNDQKVLDGSFGTATFQIGANVGETIAVGLSSSMKTVDIGRTADYVGGLAYNSAIAVGQQGTSVNASALVSGDVTIAVGSSQAVAVGASVAGAATGQTAASAFAKAAAINSAGISGVTATADTTLQFDLATTAVAATETAYNLSINGTSIYTNYDGVTNGAITADQVVAAINTNSSSTGVTASYDSANTRLTLSAADGRNVALVQNAATNTTSGMGAAEGANNTGNTTTGSMAIVTAGTAVSKSYVGSIRLTAAAGITVGGAAPVRIGTAASSYAVGSQALNSASVTTVANSNTTITRVDAALQSVAALRSSLGAIQSRFESVVTSLQTASENLQASRGRIQDADFAKETARLTRAQILQQAGTAILAQANAVPQNVLQLLR
jgi:flagellin